MNFKISRIFFFFILIGSLLGANTVSFAQKPKFTLVIDAGHGGHDPGAIGSFAREKDINLAITLQLGELIQNNFKDVKVVYTRKTDVYLTLQERADIVNKNHADLFISIHTNSAKSTAAYGTETFTLGLAKTKSNLDVAMRENSVILLEDDYQTKYKGFDPSSVDSYIMFEFMQDKYIDRSIDLASNIQKQFVGYARRSDRGVRQAGFWVLHRSACPSVLIELGFISNANEEKYLTSKNGQKELAASIYNAFVKFKSEHDKKSGVANSQVVKEIQKNDKIEEVELVQDTAPAQIDTDQVVDNAFAKSNSNTATSNSDKAVFKVQILASSQKLPANSPKLKGIKNAELFVENGMYKYTVGAETNYDKILKTQKDLKAKFPDCFIIAFVGKEKITAKEALKMIK